MTDNECAEMRLLVQADVDGELSPHDAAGGGRASGPLPSLRRRCKTQLIVAVGAHPAGRAVSQGARRGCGPPCWPDSRGEARQRQSPPRWRRLARPLLPFGGGFALAACLALLLLVPSAGGLPDAVVSDHIRALQPGHLMDVVSTDQHTVKPWFDGRLDFAPPVKDFKAEGFPLAGGRLDYIAGHPAAALIYQRRKHLIDLYVWPDHGRPIAVRPRAAATATTSCTGREGGMSFWAVSDLGAEELADFVKLWRAG